METAGSPVPQAALLAVIFAAAVGIIVAFALGVALSGNSEPGNNPETVMPITVTPAATPSASPPTKTQQPTATVTDTPTPTATPTVTSPALHVGGNAVVANLGGDGLNVRSGPGTAFQVIASLRDGEFVNLTSESVQGGDYRWWQVRLDDGTVGWVAEGPVDGSARWLIPVGMRPTPTSVPPTVTPTPIPTLIPTAAATPTRTATPRPTRTPIAGPFRLQGRASTPDGTAVVGIDVAIIKGSFRTDVDTGEDGTFLAWVPEAGIYQVSAVGVLCARNTWFSGGGCTGYNLLVEVGTNVWVSIPSDTQVALRYTRTTVVVQGTIKSGKAHGVRAIRSDGVVAWSEDVSPDGDFRLGLVPGTWRIFARNFNPGPADGPALTVTVGTDGTYSTITLTAPSP